jgi:hypothetical protein
MSIKTISAAIVGVMLIAASAFYVHREPQAGADAATNDLPTSHGTEAAPTAQPRAPEATAAANEAPLRTESPRRPDAPLPQAGAPAPIGEALEELKLPPVPELLETERAFAAEAVDPRWSQEAEAHILGEIAQITGLKLVTLQVECKTTLCRLHVAQQELRKGPGPIMDIVARLGMKTRWVISVEDRNGVPTSLAYLERGSVAADGPPAGGNIEIRRSKAE